jgi:hypothetical protein
VHKVIATEKIKGYELLIHIIGLGLQSALNCLWRKVLRLDFFAPSGLEAVVGRSKGLFSFEKIAT